MSECLSVDSLASRNCAVKGDSHQTAGAAAAGDDGAGSSRARGGGARDGDAGGDSSDSDAGDESDDDANDDAEPSVFFKQESTPEYLIAQLNDYALQGKLRLPRALEVITTVREKLVEIDALLLAYRPPLASRAAEWRAKRALFEAALVSASPAVEIGKLLPFKL